MWTPLFFGFGQRGLAFADIAVLWALAGTMVVVYWRARRAAALLPVPYRLWVSYATALNLAIWLLNR